MERLIIPLEHVGQVSDSYHTFEELYNHRNLLFIAILNAYPAYGWKSRKHHTGERLPGWFIAGLDLPTGPITYHLPDFL
jgi:hypothetical protein